MSDYLLVPVAVAAEISERFEKDIVIVICWNAEHNKFHMTTFGRAAIDKVNAADLGEILADAAGAVLSEKTVYEDFRLDAARLKEENDRLKRRIAELEAPA